MEGGEAVTASTDTATLPEMSPDLVFDILSNTRRRMVLYYLRQYGGSATVQELADEIAAMENDVEIEELTRQQQKRVYVSLYQTHLPKLEESGISEYDDEREEVRLTGRANEIDHYLTTSENSTYPWQTHYLALAIFGGLLLVLSAAGVAGFAMLSSFFLGLVLMTGFAVSSVVQYWQYKQQQQSLPVELLAHES